jgi:hypothetical protein
MNAAKKVFSWLGLLGLLWLGLAGCNSDTSDEQSLEQAALVDTGTYILSAKHTGMALEVNSSNAQLIQNTRNSSSAQQWRVEAVDGTNVKITSLVNGYALTASSGGSVSVQPYSATREKQWVLVPKAGGYYEVANRASRALLGVTGAATTAGAAVSTSGRASVDNQKWTLEKVGGTVAPTTGTYEQNLALIKGATVRNRNLDNSAYRNTPLNSLPTGDSSPLLGPRADYLAGEYGPGGNPEPGFPARGVGTFRTSCEFSHFAYDDPLVHPNKPGAAHLHMFWGNTDVNAYSTYNTLKDSGSSTCNGQELNRTGYWAPAMFDAQGNVRIPERVIIYYKGYGLAQGNSEVYPPKAAMVINDIVHRTPDANGGTLEMNFYCTNQFRGVRSPASLTIPNCKDDGSIPFRRVLEMHVKFPNCWNGLDAANPKNWVLARFGSWFYSNCVADGNKTFPNIHYIIAYPLEPGESTAGWYLASDVDPTTRQRTKTGGSSVHADWWGGWHPGINKEWIDNCVNLKKDSNGDGTDDVDHGCGFGYLSDGGPSDNNPLPGRALKFRQQYTGPIKVAASTLYRELCPGGSAISTATAAAYCRPAPMNMQMSGGAEMNNFSHDHH